MSPCRFCSCVLCPSEREARHGSSKVTVARSCTNAAAGSPACIALHFFSNVVYDVHQFLVTRGGNVCFRWGTLAAPSPGIRQMPSGVPQAGVRAAALPAPRLKVILARPQRRASRPAAMCRTAVPVPLSLELDDPIAQLAIPLLDDLGGLLGKVPWSSLTKVTWCPRLLASSQVARTQP